jgi:hypothetical protein
MTSAPLAASPFALVLLAAAALSGAAVAAEPPAAASTPAASPCFRMSQIRNHRIVGRDTIYMKVGFRDVYKVTTAGSCTAGAMPDETLIMSTVGGMDRICRPIDLDLKIRNSGGFVSPCIVTEIAKLSPEQIAALPKKSAP